MPNLMLVAVFLSCRSIALDNRYSTVDVYYLQPLCKGWFSVFAFAMWLQMLMLLLLPHFNLQFLSDQLGCVCILVAVLIMLPTFIQILPSIVAMLPPIVRMLSSIVRMLHTVVTILLTVL